MARGKALLDLPRVALHQTLAASRQGSSAAHMHALARCHVPGYGPVQFSRRPAGEYCFENRITSCRIRGDAL